VSIFTITTGVGVGNGLGVAVGTGVAVGIGVGVGEGLGVVVGDGVGVGVIPIVGVGDMTTVGVGEVQVLGGLFEGGELPQTFVAVTLHSYVSIPLSGNENLVLGAWTVSDETVFPVVVSFTVTLYDCAPLIASHLQTPCDEVPFRQAGGVGVVVGVGVGTVQVFSGLLVGVPAPHSFVAVTMH